MIAALLYYIIWSDPFFMSFLVIIILLALRTQTRAASSNIVQQGVDDVGIVAGDWFNESINTQTQTLDSTPTPATSTTTSSTSNANYTTAPVTCPKQNACPPCPQTTCPENTNYLDPLFYGELLLSVASATFIYKKLWPNASL